MSEQPQPRTPAEGLRRYTPTLRRRWRMVLTIVACAALTGFLVASLSAKSYEATAKVLLDQQRQVDALLGTNDFSPDPERDVNTGIQLITLEPIANRVRRSLRLAAPASTLAAKVTTKVDSNSNIVSITARDASAARAARIANGFAAGYRDYRARWARAAVDDAIGSAQARLQRLGPGAERNALASELRRLQVAGAFQTGGVQVVHAATAAAATARPRPLLSAFIAGILGVLVAAAAVVVLARGDKRVRSERQLEEATGRPVIARVPTDADAAEDAMATLALWLARSRGQMAPPAVVLLTSAGRGEGASEIALGFARSLDAMGEIAVAIETDLREPSFASRLGVDEPEGLVGVLDGSADLNSALVSMGGACALPAGPAVAHPQPVLAGDAMADLIQELRGDSDVVVMAGAPVGVVGDALALVALVDMVVLVACIDVTRTDELERAMSALEAAGAPPVGIVAAARRSHPRLAPALSRLRGIAQTLGPLKRRSTEPAHGGAGSTTEVPVS